MTNLFIAADLPLFSILVMGALVMTMYKKNNRSAMRERLFLVFVISVSCMLLLDALCIIVNGHGELRGFVLALNTLYLLIQPLPAAVFLLFADYIVLGKSAALRKKAVRVSFYVIVSFVFPLINLAFPVFFSVGADGVYRREFLLPLLFAFHLAPLAYSTWFLIDHRSRLDKREFLPLVLFPVPAAIGCAIQFFCPGVSLIWEGVALSVLSLYLHLQSRQLTEDYLTGAFNRRCLDEYIDARIRKCQGHGSFSGFMIDLDNFKKINDRFGHRAGDAALISSVQILRAALRNMDFVARYAGDEFVVILETTDPNSIESILVRIQQEVDAFNSSGQQYYNLGFSIGVGTFDPLLDENADRFLNRIDAAMYEIKRRKKVAMFSS